MKCLITRIYAHAGTCTVYAHTVALNLIYRIVHYITPVMTLALICVFVFIGILSCIYY